MEKTLAKQIRLRNKHEHKLKLSSVLSLHNNQRKVVDKHMGHDAVSYPRTNLKNLNNLFEITHKMDLKWRNTKCHSRIGVFPCQNNTVLGQNCHDHICPNKVLQACCVCLGSDIYEILSCPVISLYSDALKCL